MKVNLLRSQTRNLVTMQGKEQILQLSDSSVLAMSKEQGTHRIAKDLLEMINMTKKKKLTFPRG